jgi:hypothetical protein
MGLHEHTTSHNNFLSVKHGSLCLESSEPREGYDQVTVNNPSTNEDVVKYIKRYAALDGKIKKLEWYDRETNGVRYLGLKIHIRDGAQHFQLDLPFGKRHFDYFTKVMDNIDFANVVEFHAWPDRKDKRQTAFVIKQGDNYVQWKYTKDDMGDCPQPKQDVMGKWDFHDQRVWLYKRLIEVIIPQVEAMNAFDEPEPEYTGTDDDVPAVIAPKAMAAPMVNDPNDDIPF